MAIWRSACFQVFAEQPQTDRILLPGNLGILLRNLIKDGMLTNMGHTGQLIGGVPPE